MDMEDQSEIDYQLDLDEDSSVIFDIPEEILEIDQDFGSDSGSLGYLDKDDGSLEPDGSDSGMAVVITICQKLSHGFKNSC
jgi:hypothetical protein